MSEKQVIVNGAGDEAQKVTIPDDAIYYIVNQYLMFKQGEGSQVVKGLSPEDVEAVLHIFIDWADKKGYVKNNTLIMGGTPIG